MELQHFTRTLSNEVPDDRWPAPLQALWWDARGDWAQAHGLVDDLETNDGMAVHAYLHQREGDAANAEYWYRRAGSQQRRPTLEAEWKVLVEMFLLQVARHEASS
jgi:hypothetical protein